MHYEIQYKLLNSQNEQSWDDENLTLEEIKDAIIQLSKGMASFDGVLIQGFSALEKLKIIEKNYQFESNGYHYISSGGAAGDINYPGYIALEDILEEHELPGYNIKDITNKVYSECNITGNTTKKNGNSYLNRNILCISGNEFSLKLDSKIYDIFDILLKSRVLNNSLEVTYENMLEIYNRGEYKNLLAKDIKESAIRDLIKKKIVDISKDLKLENPYLKITTRSITFQF